MTGDEYLERRKEIEDFVYNHTTYLIDAGFKISFIETTRSIDIRIAKNEGFIWKDIEDDVIPLYHILSSKYGIEGSSIDVDSLSNIKFSSGCIIPIKKYI